MDKIFKALNDPARRALLDSLRSKDGQSLTDLEEQLDMSRFGVMKHLKVLEDANLILPRKVGRFKYHYLNALPLQEVIDRWIEPFLAKPQARTLIDLKSQLETETMTKPDFMMQTFINCTQDALWEALINADTMGQYVIATDKVRRDGDALHYVGDDGSSILICNETKLTPKTRIDSTFEPHWAGPDVPLEASTFSYIIEPRGSACKLTLEHHKVPAGQEGVAEGWSCTLSSLKTLLETGNPVKYTMQMADAS
jgi:DNA-binding transcriptional ArsR family regulator/uncharacterized protein YndB with AHSA1/START domain